MRKRPILKVLLLIIILVIVGGFIHKRRVAKNNPSSTTQTTGEYSESEDSTAYSDSQVANTTTSNSTTCKAPFKVGYTSKTINGVSVSMWYPTDASEKSFAYNKSISGNVAQDATPASCKPVPLVVFSHGFGGCKTQSVFFTEQLARNGYVVVAPDHADASCGSDSTREPANPSFRDIASWTDTSYKNRGVDIKNTIDGTLALDEFKSVIDANKIGMVGHSLGGYTSVATAGGWDSWKDSRIKAVLALSPFVAPFVDKNTLSNVTVPIMYQGGTLDIGITPSLKGDAGAYTESNTPKYFVELKRAGHFAWTNRSCSTVSTVSACIKSVANVALINNYGISFFEQYLKSTNKPILTKSNSSLSSYIYQK